MMIDEKNAIAYSPPMGRKLLYAEKTLIRLPDGTLAAIASTQGKAESLGDWLRLAVANEMTRRSKPARKAKGQGKA